MFHIFKKAAQTRPRHHRVSAGTRADSGAFPRCAGVRFFRMAGCAPRGGSLPNRRDSDPRFRGLPHASPSTTDSASTAENARRPTARCAVTRNFELAVSQARRPDRDRRVSARLPTDARRELAALRTGILPQGKNHCTSLERKAQSKYPQSSGPLARYSPGRCRFLQRLRDRNRRSQQPDLRSGAAGNPLRRLAPPRGHAAGHRTRLRATWSWRLLKTCRATPEPRIVVAVGACGISGGIFGRNYATVGGGGCRDSGRCLHSRLSAAPPRAAPRNPSRTRPDAAAEHQYAIFRLGIGLMQPVPTRR